MKIKDTTLGTKTSKNLRPEASTATSIELDPVFFSEPLTAFGYDSSLARHEEVVVTIKTTMQLEKNQHQEEYLKRPNKVFGRDTARPYLRGIVAAFSLAHERFDWTLAESKWAFSATEPYGVDARGNKMALATADSVQLIDIRTGEEKLCQTPWLKQAHTVEFSEDGKRLLVGSAGFDAIFEFDTATGDIVWEWFAWDNGFDQSKMGHYVVRSEERYKTLTNLGHEVLLVNDPTKHPFGIPTKQKPAHLNSACYDSSGGILVTLFHQGAGYAIDRSTGRLREIISGLVVPHKLSRKKKGGYFISDTRRGRVILLDENYRPNHEIVFAGTPGIARSPHLSEFLQNATELRDNLFACVDIHRSTLWLVDMKRRRYRGIKFPVEWSMHDVASLGKNHQLLIGSLVGTRFGRVAAFKQQLKIIHHFAAEGHEITALVMGSENIHNEVVV